MWEYCISVSFLFCNFVGMKNIVWTSTDYMKCLVLKDIEIRWIKSIMNCETIGLEDEGVLEKSSVYIKESIT